MAIPETLLALCVVAAMGASAVSLIVAMTVACVPGNCRLVRSTVLSIVDAEYVEAARACGMSDLQIIVKEIIPNCLARSSLFLLRHCRHYADGFQPQLSGNGHSAA